MSDPVTPSSGQSEVPRAALVVAVLNEAENIEAVHAEITAAFAGLAYEVVYVDDGSTDATPDLITAMKATDPHIRLLRHDHRCGKSEALRTGIKAARAEWIGTLDGDGQNDPVDIVDMLKLAWAAEGRAPLVAGIRVRRDDPVSRLIATRIANGFRQAVLGDRCPDTGCGMKVFTRADFLMLPIFEGVHRFLPALFQRYGAPLICHPVKHRARIAGVSKYTNFGRAIVGIGDMLGVIWLSSRTRLPKTITEV